MSGAHQAAPTKEGAPDTEGARGEKETEHRDSAADEAAADKTFAKLAAKAAGAGCCLYRLAGGGFLLTRWAAMRELPDLRSVAQLLAAMGVR